ncbi:MMPL family transporter [Saccharomonospora viridis]|uniref:Membrane protein n=2 Tax=Saccharomonospora viridis TaxID=1852 RepID=A0A837DCZ5_9PSEU|nr:MMPL family transporter [Saccharomonospora viridis]KHF45350.1 membrane protein [Saccharomonospora viridis]SFP78782.1 putative drug exporter of the RND superfamily [Saccharomonospora viridis]
MATFLARLGRASFRRRRLVTSLWVLLLVVFGIGALTMSGQTTNSVTIPGTEAQQAIDRLEERFPEAGVGKGSVNVAVAPPEGQQLDPQIVAGLVKNLGEAPNVATVTDPFQTKSIAPDGSLALIQVVYRMPSPEVTDADRDALQAAAQSTRDAGWTVEFGGDAMQGIPVTQPTEGIGVIVAAVVLIVTFGSLVAAGLPLVTALIGVGIGMAGITALSGVVDLNANTPVLALMIGLAVGIDYALFIVSRYRTELESGAAPEDAAATAVGTAGSAVVFAGLTVIIALAGLTVVGIPILGQMGLAASATVAIAVLIAITLLPAVLGFAGTKVLGGRIPGLRRPARPGPTAGWRWSSFLARRRVAMLLATVAGLAVLAVPAADMRLGLPNDATAAPDSTQRKAYDLISESFGPGLNGPLVVVLDAANDPQSATQAAMQRINALDNVAMVMPPQFNRAHDTALLTVIPSTGPETQETEDLVADIRALSGQLEADTGATMSVTGATAMDIDISQRMADALLPYLSLVVGLAFILLMIVFRSVLVPLSATLGFLGSVGATFGAVVAVFQWGWLGDLLGVDATGPVMSVLPVLLIGVLFGLAMDYQVFLVTRMREEYVHGRSPDEAMITGFKHGSRVVVAAALIMISVFAGFVLAESVLIQSIGFALAFGVAVDAFVVRMTIVPALMSLLGRSAWWLPRWLDRVLPNVDVEGEKLTRGTGGDGGSDGDRELEPLAR